MKLHEELNNANTNLENDNDVIIDQTNKLSLFNQFKNEFNSRHQSIISEIFYSINCNNCQT